MLLIVGGDSQIGKALVSYFTSDETCVCTTRKRDFAERRLKDSNKSWIYFDLNDDPSDWCLPKGITHAWLLAGETNQQACRLDPSGSRRLNVTACLQLSEILLAGGAFVTYASTNLVLPGDSPFSPPETPTAPASEYGRQKAETEHGIQTLGGSSTAIVRLSKVLSPGYRLFREWRLEMSDGRPIHPISNLVIAPINMETACRSLISVGLGARSGIYQMSSDRDVTYADIGFRLADYHGFDSRLVLPKTAAELGVEIEYLPKFATLDSTSLTRDYGIAPPSADEIVIHAIK